MNRAHRRRFLSTIALGGTVGLAGCVDGVMTDDDGGQEPRDPDDGDDDEPEVTSAEIESFDTGSGQMEIEVEAMGKIHERGADLVVQAYPYNHRSPEVEPTDDEVVTLETIPITGRGVHAELDYQPNVLDSKDDFPTEPNGLPFGFQLGVQYDDKQDVNILEIHDNGYTLLQYKEDGQEVTELRSGGTIRTWVEDDEFHYAIVHRLSMRSNYYDTEEVEATPLVTTHSINTDELSDLDDIYENDPLEWQTYLDTRSSGSLSNIEYLDRPMFESIAETISEGLDWMNLTEDDDLFVRSAYNVLSIIEYDQPWDTVAESVRVPYPEQLYRDGGGDCKAQGFMVNGILHHLRYDTSLFLIREETTTAQQYHHMGGGVGMDLDPETSEIGERIQSREGREANWRHPEAADTDERSLEHVLVDPSTNSIGGYNSHYIAITYDFVEGR